MLMNPRPKVFFSKSERGQSLILIALIFVGLLAFIGLTVDIGILFVSYGNLRRAVDSAALAAATQLRGNYTTAQLTDSAKQFLILNNVSGGTATVQTCNDVPGDPQLCGATRRKLVRVTASVPVQFSFLPVIGFSGTTITANAIGEAASMDAVLVIDISESMAKDDPTGVHPEYKDPHNCNVAGTCHPFNEVKSAAANTFTDWILNKPSADEEDRLAVVVFSNGWQYTYSADGTIPLQGTGLIRPDGTATGSPWMNDNATAKGLINNLKVYENNNAFGAQPWMCPAGWQGSADILGSCSEYSNPLDPNSTFITQRCPLADPNPNANMQDNSSCQTTNIGGGLKLAAATLGSARKEALWLVILLTDGAANTTEVTHAINPSIVAADGTIFKTAGKYILPLGFCPPGTEQKGCRDNSVTTRHPTGNPAYDADDYARDMADLVSCSQKSPAVACSRAGQGAVMFGIGLGSTVVGNPVDSGGTPFGDTLLRYVGAVGDDGNPASDPCSSVTLNAAGYNCGNYYFTPNGSGLDMVFTQIASRIYTRLTK